ncbi:rough deal protein C-terminal region-domain-containing protein [Catenaria anguillulae PL171]|uniref:Rough deal protein C-terminal region-domain-containing protein n=1 Tax=Catenaria anguillulae PL171 TaxID=765915 RepID=A0A1Y2HTM6_9FUNG|nr:rough deal protein C-terminal region-domain-containing protein [Catenaria anguillulae PL171]
MAAPASGSGHVPTMAAHSGTANSNTNAAVSHMHCARSAQALAICVNDRLLILDNMITSDSIASTSFPPALHSHPPAVAISPDGEFWASAAANGDVTVTHVHTKIECLVSALPKGPHHLYELILVFKHHVTRIYNLELDHFSAGPLTSTNLNSLANKLLEPTVATYPSQRGCLPSSLIVFTPTERPQRCSAVSMWHFGDSGTRLVRAHASLPKAKSTDPTLPSLIPGSISMYTLSDLGHISVWGLPHLVCLRTSQIAYMDFSVFTQPEPNRPGTAKVMLIVHTRTPDKALVSLPLTDGGTPGSKHMFATNAPVPRVSALQRPPYAAHAPAYAAGAGATSSPEHMLPVVLRFRGGVNDRDRKLQLLRLQETLPQSQLDALVAGHQWDDALKLARQFNMDVQPVLKQRLLAAVHEASAHVVMDFNAELGPLLDQVECPRAKMDACLQVRCTRMDDAVAALARACDLLRNVKDDPAVTRRMLGKQYSADTWHEFCTQPIEKVALMYAAAGEIGKLALLWSRHCNDGMEDVRPGGVAEAVAAASPERPPPDAVTAAAAKVREPPMKRTIDTIVQALPESVSASELCAWLRTAVFPTIAAAKKRVIDKWLEDRAVALATKVPGHGAKQALMLVQLVLEPVSVAAYGATMHVTEQWRTQMYKVKPTITPRPALLKLRDQLEDIVYLSEQIDYEVGLAEYKRREPMQIAMGVLDRVAALEALDAAVATRFDPYVARHGLDRDNVLLGYCERVLEGAVGDRLLAQQQHGRGGGGRGAAQSMFAATWQERVLKLALHMGDVTKRSKVLLELTSRIPIPWSHAIESAVLDVINRSEYALNTDANVDAVPETVNELQGQYKRMDLYRMLQGYNITAADFDASNIGQARYINRLFAKHDSMQAIKDSLRFAATYGTLDSRGVFISFLQHHMVAMMPDKWRAYLDELKGHRLAHYAYLAASGVCKYYAEVLGRDLYPQMFVYPEKEPRLFLVDGGRACEAISVVKAMYRLDRELDGFDDVKPQDIDSPEKRLAFFVARSRSLPSGVSRSMAEVLDIDQVQVHQLLIRQALEDGNGNGALLLATEMLHLQCSVHALLPVLHDFLAYIDEDLDRSRVSTRLVQGMVALSQHCIVSADEGSAAEALDIFKLISAFKQVFDQTEQGEYRVAVGRRSLSARDAASLARPRSNDSGVNLPGASPIGSNFSSSMSSSLSSSYLAKSRAEIAAQVEESLPKHFFDQGLVLSSSQIIPKCSNFVRAGLHLLYEMYPRSPSLQLAARQQQAQAASTSNNKAKSKAKGKVGSKLRADADPLAVLKVEGKSIVDDLMAANQYQLALVVLHVMGSFLANNYLLGHTDMATIVAIDALSAPIVDQTMVLGYLLAIHDMRKMVEAMNKAKAANDSKLSNMLALSCVGVVVGNFMNEHLFATTFRDFASSVVWWHQFDLLGIPYDRQHFPGERSGQANNVLALRGYVDPLLMATNCDLMVALEFARAFEIGEDIVYLRYIAQHLGVSQGDGGSGRFGSGASGSLTSSSSLSISASSLSASLKNNTLTDQTLSIGYKDAVATVHSEITAESHDELVAIYSMAISQSDPFDYDRIDFLLKQLQSVVVPEVRPILDRCTRVLAILSLFDKPSTSIKDMDVEYARARGLNEDWAAKRLNSLALICPILGLDLGPDTDNLAVPLGFGVDQFYGQAALQKEYESTRTGAPLKYAEIQPLIDNIQDPGICGQEKARAIRKALSFAQQAFLDANKPLPDWMRAQLLTAQRDLRVAEIETVLRDNKLLDARYFDLTVNPPKLIEQLYLDSPKLVARGGIEEGFSIHEVASRIAEVSELDFTALLRDIFIGMISTKDAIPEGELPSAGFRSIDWSLQQAAVTLLSAYPPSEARNMLVSLSFGEGDKNLTSSIRIRALDLVQKMPSKIVKTINGQHSIDAQKAWALSVLHLRDHQHLGITRTLEEVLQDPTAVVRSLWLNHRNKAKCPQLIVNICLDFAINDLDLLDKCLDVLLERKFFTYLSHQLVAVSRVFPAIPNLATHWRRFLTGFVASIPARHPSLSLTEDRDWSNFWTITENIVDCPLILDVMGIDLQYAYTLLEMAVKHGIEPWLIVFAGLPVSSDRSVAILASVQVRPLDVLKIVDSGTWINGGRRDNLRQSMRERLFAYAAETRMLKEFLNTPWLEPALRFCLKRGMFPALVREASPDEALQLVRFFFRETSQVAPEGVDIVQHFLATQGRAQAAVDADEDEFLTF